MNYTIAVENEISGDDFQYFVDRFKQYNESKIGKQQAIPVNFLVKDNKMVVGGISATIIWGWLMIDNLFVKKDYRGKGLGGLLLRTAITEAINKGVQKASLGTIFEETVEICSKYGFAVDGTLEDRPPGRNYYFLKNDHLAHLAARSHADCKLIAGSEISAEDSRAFAEMIQADKEGLLGKLPFKEIKIFARDEDRKILGGLTGYFGWGWMYISVLWVDDSLRGRGIGQQLVNKAETEAISFGVNKSFMGTTDFQAREFYEKMGYEIFSVRTDLPPGYRNYSMRKSLV